MIALVESSPTNAGPNRNGGDLAGLLAAVASGDRPALARLYQRTSAKLYGICLRVLRDQADAEEALQDIFVTIWNKARLYDRAKSAPLTWLSVLARNKAVDRVRIKRIATGGLDEAAEFPDDSPSALDVLEAADDRARLTDCLEQLEERYRSLIRDAFVDGASYPELAAREDVPLGTMKSWIRRSLLRLRGCLEQ
ncbi:MAG: sigma-70 family RNA polymerase sigma factor [Sphingomicrobium sp.]